MPETLGDIMDAERVVVVGRFQPPHLGHLHLIRQALYLAREAIIVVGSAQESHTLENPLTAGERVEALKLMLEEELGEDFCRRVAIIPVADIAMNKVWVQYLRMLLPRFDAAISGNELVLMLFEDMGIKTYKPELYKRDSCSGTRIREMAAKGGDWESCLHPRVRDFLGKIGFEERIRRLSG
ncbi:MAG: nicotinamide-nucleotide adenylyltransferase [Aeropyrum sp.]|nr:nicotinamide-nucleotide adenylyltransferase [Aeropyrum sp.]